MPLQETSGTASYDAFGGGVAAVPNYIEDVFSTWLYTGNGSTQTITNGIDLAGKGGAVWIKSRSAATNHALADSTMNLSAFECLISNANNAKAGNGDLNAFNSNGFSLGYYAGSGNASGSTYASWTFRKAPKFFDVVTYTGNGASGRAISHSLGSIPGCIIVKATSTTSNWFTWHIASGITAAKTGFQLNATNAATITTNSTGLMTATSFDVGEVVDSSINWPNTNGVTYIAYLFAHNAGGFGLTGTDNVISCGSYTGTSDYVGPVVDLGFEPQWLLIKSAGSVKNWVVLDNMRGLTANGDNEGYLVPNTSDQEYSGTLCKVNATGFQASGSSMVAANGVQYIYIAIRRGPMKVPTDATKVYTNAIQTSGVTPTTSTTGFPVDLIIQSQSPAATNKFWSDRLRGSTTNNYNYLISNANSAESTGTGGGIGFDNNTGFVNNLISSNPLYDWCFRRAPSFFDEVCCAAPSYAITDQPHNLGVTPELFISKPRTNAGPWLIYGSVVGTQYQYLDFSNGALQTAGVVSWSATSTTFSEPSTSSQNNYVTYLFATCAGVSKVGSYTGTGALQTINCGFTSGARFVLIKRTDSTGDWWTYDSARGITSGNDPYLYLNSTAAEVTGTNYVDTDSTGFKVTAAAPAGLNASGGSYIFLAIA